MVSRMVKMADKMINKVVKKVINKVVKKVVNKVVKKVSLVFRKTLEKIIKFPDIQTNSRLPDIRCPAFRLAV